MQYGEDVGVLTQVYIPEEGHVELCIATEVIDGVNRLMLMDSRGNEFAGEDFANFGSVGSALSNYFRVMGFTIDDVYNEYPDMSYEKFRLPSDSIGSFNPVGLHYGGNQMSYIPAMSRMSEGDEFAVFVNGQYILNRLERSGSTLVYRTYVLPCNPAVDDAGLVYGYDGKYQTGFNIQETIYCMEEISDGSLSDWWYQLGVEPLPYQFEQVVYYTDSIRLMPLMFVEY